MTTRRKLVVGNWKMHGSHAANAELLQGVLAARPVVGEVAVCVPFPYLSEVAVTLANSGVAGARNAGARLQVENLALRVAALRRQRSGQRAAFSAEGIGNDEDLGHGRTAHWPHAGAPCGQAR